MRSGRGRAVAHAVQVLAALTALLTAVLVGGASPAVAEPGRVRYPAPAVGSWPGVVVGLGDSVPSGTNCGCVPYVSLVARGLTDADTGAAHVRNLARGGLTSSSVLAQLRDPGIRSSVASASAVIVTVGANDLSPAPLSDPTCRPVAALACYRAAIATLAGRVDRLLADLDSLTATGEARVLVTGYWNVFLDGSVGRRQGRDYVIGSDALTRAVNAVIATAARRHHAQYVDIYTPFKGSGNVDCTPLLAADGDHPDARGHRVIADALLGALTRRL
jgi:lysophospholipase L1-like esterase